MTTLAVLQILVGIDGKGGDRRRVRVLEFELYSRPVISGDEVALLLEDTSVAGGISRNPFPAAAAEILVGP